MGSYRETTTFRDKSFSAYDICRIFTNNLTQSEQWQVGQFILKWYDLLEEEEKPPLPDFELLIEETFKWIDDLTEVFDLIDMWDFWLGLPKIIQRGYNLFDRWKYVFDNWNNWLGTSQ